MMVLIGLLATSNVALSSTPIENEIQKLLASDGTENDIDAALRFLRLPESLNRFQIDPDRIILGGYS